MSNQTLTSSVCSVMQIGSEYYISSNDQFTEWHFEKYEDGYAIWSGTEENKNYINTAWTKTNGDGGLKLSDKPETFYLERDTTGKYARQMRIRNAKDYAINWCGGGNKNKLWFALWKEAQKDRPSCNDYMILATPMQTNMLFFDVNLPTILGSPALGKEDGWLEKTPSTQTYVTNVDSLNDQPDGYTEGLGAAGKLYQEKYGDDAENPYTKLYRYHIIDDYQFTNQSNSAHYLYDFDYYKEIRFLGWSYTDSGGTKHIFNANAPITRQDNSTYLITDQTGTAIAIPNGTTFYGEWEQVSSPVEFFICYGGTILDTEGDVKVRNDAYRSLFTSCAAVGTLLYGDLTVGDSELYANEPNKEITAMITTAHDLDFDSKKLQIVLETLTDYAEQDKKVYYNIKNHGANFSMLQDSLLHWIRNDDNMVICLSTGDGNVQINNELATPENYQVRWYVLKDQRDGWHVDGILTATAEEMTITKTFRNLEENQVNEILNNGYQIVVKNGNGTILTTLTQSNAVRVSSDYKRLIWYVSGLEDGKTYTVTEEHYQSSSQKYANVTVTAQQSDFIVAPYPIPVTVNGTGENRTASLSMKKSNTHEWVGFINSYSNTYTLKLRKVDSVTENPLQNAVFALYGKYEEATDPSRIVRYTKPDGSIIILYYIKNAAPTDADGYTTIQGLHFSDTEKSYIYVLQETTVPDGYMTPIDISPEQVLEVTPSQIGNGTYALSMKNTAKTESLTIQKLVSEQLQEKDVSYSIHLKITDTVNFAQAVKKYPFPYVIFNADETIAATGIFEEGTETVISIKAGQTIKIQAVPIGFTYELTEEITDATGTILYKPCITTADGSVWEHTITGIIQESKAQQSENWITIKNYRADAVPEQKDITVQKQWDDSIQHSDITVLLYQMQTNRNTGTSTTILYDTQTLNDANQWAYTWSNVPRSDKTNDYSYYSGWL
ncbi:SpaA isopeptide-forming pilin-related protein [Ruminococcus sp.]|uniref:SpaA isopeptide-forming pilin-related protein n=1 Tax=Ruminococcus sp. TaxID=41978 RepID=UPI0039956175